MKVTMINTASEGGGAALASKRLMDALNLVHIKVHLLVLFGKMNQPQVKVIAKNFLIRKLGFLLFVFEKVFFLFFEKNKSFRFSFSPAITGFNIANLPIVRNSDLIHLHWITNSFISLNGLNQIFRVNKPIVWTLHDMWAFTGGCHYSGNCTNFQIHCSKCPMLRSTGLMDISYNQFVKKNKIYLDKNLTIVTCSLWLKSEVEKSALLKSKRVVHIPNPIKTDVFKPLNKEETRKIYELDFNKVYLLFGAANISDSRKGLKYLIEALQILHHLHPETSSQLEMIVFGKCKESFANHIPYPTKVFKYISDQSKLIELYNAVDAFVLPSLEDNLPNTIMEAHSCGIPVIGFKAGGVSEMIDHQINGYLAEKASSSDLSNGIYWTLFQSNRDILSKNSREKVERLYDEKIVAQQYAELYRSILEPNN